MKIPEDIKMAAREAYAEATRGGYVLPIEQALWKERRKCAEKLWKLGHKLEAVELVEGQI